MSGRKGTLCRMPLLTKILDYATIKKNLGIKKFFFFLGEVSARGQLPKTTLHT